jgi:MFS family permease
MATSALAVFGMFSIAARLVWGYLSARHDIKALMVVQAALAAMGIVFILTVQNNFMLFAWAVYQGLTLAVFFQLQALLVVTYFGRAHIGAIRGVMFPFITLGSASGPMIIGALRDWLGSYNIPFTMVIITWILAGVVIYMAKPPKVESTEAVA